MRIFKANNAIFDLDRFEAFEFSEGTKAIETPFDINEHPLALAAFNDELQRHSELVQKLRAENQPEPPCPVAPTTINQQVPCWEIRLVRIGGQSGYAWIQHLNELDAKQMWGALQSALVA